jgi:hypothetical protein
VTEQPAKRGHLACEIVFLDSRIRPDTIQQLVFCDQAIAMFEKHGENIERLGRNRYRMTLSPQPSRHRVGDERSKGIGTVPD